MSIWQVGLLMWSVAGFAMVTFMDAAMRHEGEGLLFGHETKFDATIGLLVAVFVFIAWPAILIYCVVVTVRGGDVQLASAPLRKAPQPEPLPARQPNPSWMPPEDDEELLCRMIRLRLKKDSRLAGQGPPSRWPPKSLWQTPEAALLDAVQAYLELHADRLSPAEIAERINERLGGVDDHGSTVGLRAHIKHRMQREDPDYLTLGRAVLNAAAVLAVQHTRRKLDRRRDMFTYPLPDWLKETLSPVDVERDFEGLMFPRGERPGDWRRRLAEKQREWRFLALRMAEDDILKRYRADGTDRERGIALVRRGRPVGHIAAIRSSDGDAGDGEAASRH